MKPIEFEGHNVVYAKDQPEYNPLPAYRDVGGTVKTCWELNAAELEKIRQRGKVWLSQMTFNQPLQPVHLWVDGAAADEVPGAQTKYYYVVYKLDSTKNHFLSAESDNEMLDKIMLYEDGDLGNYEIFERII